LHRTIVTNFGSCEKIRHRPDNLPAFLRRFVWNPSTFHLQQNSSSIILLQRGIAIFDCEAAALPGRFLPELGRSLTRAAFFLFKAFAVLLCRSRKRAALVARNRPLDVCTLSLRTVHLR
jgi:hypothetical protein